MQMEWKRVDAYFHKENYVTKIALMQMSHFACHMTNVFIEFWLFIFVYKHKSCPLVLYIDVCVCICMCICIFIYMGVCICTHVYIKYINFYIHLILILNELRFIDML